MSLLVFEDVADRVNDNVGDQRVENEIHDQCSFPFASFTLKYIQLLLALFIILLRFLHINVIVHPATRQQPFTNLLTLPILQQNIFHF